MSVFEPVKLSPELKAEIRALAEELDVQVAAVPGQEVPDLGSSEPLRLAPQVQIKSSYQSRSIVGKKLRIYPVSAYFSPWDERVEKNWIEGDDQGREAQLREEQTEREKNFPDRLRERQRLPIFEAKDRVLTAIGRSRVTLVAADTGSGKSTQVPQFILDEAIARGHGRHVHVVCTQPRRLAAVSLASRVAWERGERMDGSGSTGHVVRWEENPPRPWGSIVFCTVGSLLPRLSKLGASHIIVDEAHTRDIHTDLLLTVLLELLRVSKDLKVIVMSATLDVSKWQGHFQNFPCELVRAGGRPYEVRRYFLEDIIQELQWQPDSSNQQEVLGVWSDVDCNRGFLDPEGRYSPNTLLTVRSLPESLVPFQLISAVLKWVDGWGSPGGVLIFLPGWHEIASCMARLQRDPALRQWEFVPLHSTVPPNEQYRAFHPARSGRKAILSTDIAETSITIPDIICVIDSGLARVKRHTNLEVVWASQANLLQRAGRAGRVQQGRCVHLFTRSRFNVLDPEPTPEMRRVPLAEALLNVCDLGLDDCTDNNIAEEDKEDYGPCAYVMTFLKQAPDPPLPKDVWNAFKELQHVGALDRAGFLTHLGALLVRLPMSPGLGSAFYFASLLGFPEAASQVAASLDGREPFSRRQNEEGGSSAMNFAEGRDGKKWSDVFAMAKALGDFGMQPAREAARFCRVNGLIHPVMQQLQSAMSQLKRVSWDLSKACQWWPDENGWGSAFEGTGEGIFPKDNVEESWPVMQTMLSLAYSWNIGQLDGGRKVNAGWSKAARWARTSVLVDEDPPCPLVTYVELTNSGGRILRGGTMVTPQQMLMCGSRGGPFWQNGMVLLENWLDIEADFESAALLAALRTCNSLVLHKAAELSLQDFRGQWIEWESRRGLLDLIQKWRRCVVQVACLPLPAKISVWDADYSRVSPRAQLALPSPRTSISPRATGAASSDELFQLQALPPLVSPGPPPLPLAVFPFAAPAVPAPRGHNRWAHRSHGETAASQCGAQPNLDLGSGAMEVTTAPWHQATQTPYGATVGTAPNADWSSAVQGTSYPSQCGSASAGSVWPQQNSTPPNQAPQSPQRSTLGTAPSADWSSAAQGTFYYSQGGSASAGSVWPTQQNSTPSHQATQSPQRSTVGTAPSADWSSAAQGTSYPSQGGSASAGSVWPTQQTSLQSRPAWSCTSGNAQPDSAYSNSFTTQPENQPMPVADVWNKATERRSLVSNLESFMGSDAG